MEIFDIKWYDWLLGVGVILYLILSFREAILENWKRVLPRELLRLGVVIVIFMLVAYVWNDTDWSENTRIYTVFGLGAVWYGLNRLVYWLFETKPEIDNSRAVLGYDVETEQFEIDLWRGDLRDTFRFHTPQEAHEWLQSMRIRSSVKTLERVQEAMQMMKQWETTGIRSGTSGGNTSESFVRQTDAGESTTP